MLKALCGMPLDDERWGFADPSRGHESCITENAGSLGRGRRRTAKQLASNVGGRYCTYCGKFVLGKNLSRAGKPPWKKAVHGAGGSRFQGLRRAIERGEPGEATNLAAQLAEKHQS